MKLLLKWAKELVMLLSLYTKSGVMLFLSKIHILIRNQCLIIKSGKIILKSSIEFY